MDQILARSKFLVDDGGREEGGRAKGGGGGKIVHILFDKAGACHRHITFSLYSSG